MSEKNKGLLVNILLYLIAYVAGLIVFYLIDNILVAEAALTATSTLIIFIITCFIKDTSLYDPYWSVAPVIMVLAAMIKYNLWHINGIIILAVITLWSLRLTINWFNTYKGLYHEDWRYSQFRKKYNPFVYGIINFFGLQYIPTIVVYAGLISSFFIIQNEGFSPLIIPGVLIMLLGIVFEFVSDRAIHRFIKENKGQRKTCNISLWKYSRHPNYLGELSFWTGMYIAFVLLNPTIWYAGLGFLSIVLLFLFISIPMMEKHNLERRDDYKEYQEQTSMLFILPNKKKN